MFPEGKGRKNSERPMVLWCIVFSVLPLFVLFPLPRVASFPSHGLLYTPQNSAQGSLCSAKLSRTLLKVVWVPSLTDLCRGLCEYIYCYTDCSILLPSCLILKPCFLCLIVYTQSVTAHRWFDLFGISRFIPSSLFLWSLAWFSQYLLQ